MRTFVTSREIHAAPESIFAAISTPDSLARWWGPAGFTNTFSVCEFRPGGRWSFVMHGPNGASYPNENIFAEIEAPSKVVLDHITHPVFRLTITLDRTSTGTRLTWSQAIADEQVAAAIEHIVVPANEQNLDRLTTEVTGTGVSQRT